MQQHVHSSTVLSSLHPQPLSCHAKDAITCGIVKLRLRGGSDVQKPSDLEREVAYLRKEVDILREREKEVCQISHPVRLFVDEI